MTCLNLMEMRVDLTFEHIVPTNLVSPECGLAQIFAQIWEGAAADRSLATQKMNNAGSNILARSALVQPVLKVEQIFQEQALMSQIEAV